MTEILLALILLFVFLMWLRTSMTYINLKRKWRLFIKDLRK